MRSEQSDFPQGNKQAAKAEPRFFYGYIVIIVAFFINAVIWGAFGAFGIFFTPILTEFGWSRAMTAGAFSLTWFMQGSLAIFAGKLNDRLGPRTVMTIAGLLMGLGYLLMTQVDTIWKLYVFYGLLLGTGMGGGYVPLTSMVLRWFSIRKSLMTAIVMSGGGLGTVIASPVANYLLSMFDWRVSYLIIGCFVLVGILVAAQFLKRDPAQMGLQPYGEQKRTEDGPKLEARGFTLKETIATRQFWIFNTFSFCLGFSAYVLVVHIVPYIIDLGISSTIGASILATIGAFSVIGRLIMGASADRIGNRMVTSIGFMVLLAALVLLLPAKDVWTFYLFAALFGFAWSSGVAVSPLVAELFGLGSHGFILALASIGFNIGAVFGPVAGGYIFDVTHSYQLAFILCIVLSIVGVILPLLLKPIKRKI